MKKEENLVDDSIKFMAQNKFQWYITIMLLMIILRALNYLSPEGFEGIVKYVSLSLFVAEGANELTNIRKF